MNLKQVFHFYFVNIDISVTIHGINVDFSVCVHKVVPQRKMSQIFCLGLSVYCMSKIG